MPQDNELLIEVARLYYEQDLTQSEISKLFYTSRSRVSRLIKQAKEEGIVEIIIHVLDGRDRQLEQKLKSMFSIDDVVILDARNLSGEVRVKKVAQLASGYLDSSLTGKNTLGITFGNVIYRIVSELRPKRTLPSMRIVQLMGAIEGKNPAIDGPDLVRRMAEIYRCEYHYLMTPLFLDDAKMKNSLLKRPSIAETRKITKGVDIVLTGIGFTSEEKEIMSWDIYKQPDFHREILETKSVGHICGYLYDENGTLVNTAIHQRMVSVDWNVFMNAEMRIGIASNPNKAKAILGALRGNLLTTLITDSQTVQNLLKLL